MSLTPHNSIPKDLILPLTGLLTEGQPWIRKVLVDTTVRDLPKDDEVQMLAYHGEFPAGVEVSWHIHNGPLIVIILQGEAMVQFGDDSFHYKAGDIFVEPIGIPHRAFNPNPDVTLVGMNIQFTPKGRPHIVNLGEWPAHPMPTEAPRGPFQPRPGLDLSDRRNYTNEAAEEDRSDVHGEPDSDPAGEPTHGHTHDHSHMHDHSHGDVGSHSHPPAEG